MMQLQPITCHTHLLHSAARLAGFAARAGGRKAASAVLPTIMTMDKDIKTLIPSDLAR
jgi:F0F1-type ATP synthase alpha subunit